MLPYVSPYVSPYVLAYVLAYGSRAIFRVRDRLSVPHPKLGRR